ncbi:hypothetical protein EDB86DRAFT_2941389 [Lactarius hatsudake]|nr:hypothetical protein EDB86DRAFT_2941389 [Lactarius hatsudake]
MFCHRHTIHIPIGTYVLGLGFVSIPSHSSCLAQALGMQSRVSTHLISYQIGRRFNIPPLLADLSYRKCSLTHNNAHRHPTVFLLASIAPRTAHHLLLTVIRLVTPSLFFWAPSFGIGALYYRDSYSSPVTSLAARLREEKTRYAAGAEST